MSLKKWATARLGGAGEAYITVEHKADGSKTVVDHASKKAAHAHGMAARREGRNIFAHSKKDAAKFGLDPRSSGGGGQERDDVGRFS